MNWIGRGRGGREGGLRVDWYSYGGYEYAFFFSGPLGGRLVGLVWLVGWLVGLYMYR